MKIYCLSVHPIAGPNHNTEFNVPHIKPNNTNILSEKTKKVKKKKISPLHLVVSYYKTSQQPRRILFY